MSRRAAGLTSSRRKWLRDREAELKSALTEAGVKPRALQHRVKHLAGIWRKMKSKGLAIEQIHDIFAFRILLETEEECYLALSALHRRFEPLLLRFKDYIAEPKDNGYQSLHTCIRAPGGLVYEVQIRTVAMHEAAEGRRRPLEVQEGIGRHRRRGGRAAAGSPRQPEGRPPPPRHRELKGARAATAPSGEARRRLP